MARVAFVLLDNKFLQVRNMPETALLFPDLAPKTDVSNDSNQPLQIIIHSEVFQKVGSTIAEIIPIILHNKGTYQILFGFCLHI